MVTKPARLPTLAVAGACIVLPVTEARGGDPCLLSWSDQFSVPGAGVDGLVTELFVFDEDGAATQHDPALYVGGIFTAVGPLNTSNVARFDGTAWHAMDAGLDVSLTSLSTFDFGAGERLVATGGYGLIPGEQLVQWDGSQWIGGPDGLPPTWLAGTGVFNGQLYISGPIVSPGISYYLRWDGSQWIGVGPGLSSVVWDQKVFDDGSGPAMFVAGSPLVIGFPNFLTTLGIAKWDGNKWEALGTGVNGEGRALAIFDDGNGEALYLGGNFLTAGGKPALRVARWRDGQWTALGAGFNNRVLSLVVFDDHSGGGPALYAGGEFIMSGTTVVNHLAKWNGTSWVAVGGGLTGGAAHTLCVFDEDGPAGPDAAALYVGGEFTHAGGVASPGIARWGIAPGCAEPCAADVDGSGGVNITDLLAVIAAWGSTTGPADVNGDSIVNIQDLLAVIAGWGPC